jgi:hypothetical protein
MMKPHLSERQLEKRPYLIGKSYLGQFAAADRRHCKARSEAGTLDRAKLRESENDALVPIFDPTLHKNFTE